MPGGGVGHIDIVKSDATAGHTLIDIMVLDPTRRNLVERTACIDLVAATNAERHNEAPHGDCTSRLMFIRFALET